MAMAPVELGLKPHGCGTWGQGLVVALDWMVSELFSSLNGCSVLGVLCLLGSGRVKRVPPAAGGAGVGSERGGVPVRRIPVTNQVVGS